MVRFYLNQLLDKVFRSSIKRTIVVLFLFVAIVPTAFISFLSFVGSQKSIHNIIAINTESKNREKHNSLTLFLSENQRVSTLVNNLIVSDTVSLNEKVQMSRILMYILKSHSYITSIEYSDIDNEYIGAVRDIFERDYSIGVSGKGTNYKYILYGVNENLDLGEVLWEEENYDSRTKPWYTEAIQANKQSWAPIYLWPNGEFGMDFVSPVVKNGKTLGVLDVSIKLNYIQDFVEKLKSYPNSQVFILEKNGLVVAATNAETSVIGTDGFPTRVQATKSKNPVLRDATKYLWSQYSNYSDIKKDASYFVTLDNKDYYLNVSTFKSDTGLDWIILNVKLRSDFEGELYKNAMNQFITLTLLTIFALLLAAGFAQSLTTPLAKLVAYSESLANDDFSADIDIKRNDEIGVLFKSFQTMANKLKNYINLLKEKEKIALDKQKEAIGKSEELEKFNKMMVGREIKMVELKKEIEKLKKPTNIQ